MASVSNENFGEKVKKKLPLYDMAQLWLDVSDVAVVGENKSEEYNNEFTASSCGTLVRLYDKRLDNLALSLLYNARKAKSLLLLR